MPCLPPHPRHFPIRFLAVSLEVLLGLVGESGVQALRGLPREFAMASRVDDSGANVAHSSPQPVAEELVIQRAFVRRYAETERCWFTFHRDTAELTANVALASDADHDGGKLLVLLGGEGLLAVERGEGEATVHPSSLMHAVTRMRGRGVRYSLIVFYRPLEEEPKG